LNSKKLAPGEKIIGLNESTIEDFWSWAYSDVLSNTNRAIFAEFIIAHTLGVTDQPRIEWDEVDIRYKGKKIEVKSAAYVQRWKQDKPSTIRLDISKKWAWNAEENEYSTQPIRASNVYVFCIFEGKDENDVLNMDFWKFYVLSTRDIDELFGEQKTIGIRKLEKTTTTVRYAEFKKWIISTIEK